jgi:hypothetical protein
VPPLELRQESAHHGLQLPDRERRTKHLEVLRQLRLRNHRGFGSAGKVQDGQRRQALPQVGQQLHPRHASHLQAADQEVTPSERGRNVRQRPGVVGNAMAAATQRRNDEGGRERVLLGNDDALPVEGIGGGRTHCEPWTRKWSGSGRLEGRTEVI